MLAGRTGLFKDEIKNTGYIGFKKTADFYGYFYKKI
jgi:hypothetical protein